MKSFERIRKILRVGESIFPGEDLESNPTDSFGQVRGVPVIEMNPTPTAERIKGIWKEDSS